VVRCWLRAGLKVAIALSSSPNVSAQTLLHRLSLSVCGKSDGRGENCGGWEMLCFENITMLLLVGLVFLRVSVMDSSH
jgi:hypothetical protein